MWFLILAIIYIFVFQTVNMKKLLVILLFFLQFHAYSQFWQSISYGLAFSYDRCYRSIDSDNDEYVSFRDSLENYGSGYHAGLRLMRPINKHFSIESGFFFQNHTFGTEKVHYADSVYSIDYNIFFTDASWHYSNKFLSIPVGLRYYLNGDRISVFIGAGIVPSILTTQIEKLKYFDDGTCILKNSYYPKVKSRFDLSGYASLGTSLFINYNTRIDLIADYEHSIIPVLRNGIKEYLFSFGFTFCISQTL
jgi:hypothetical protein